VWTLVGRLVSDHQLVLFFPDVYRFPDDDPPLVHCVAFSVDQLGMVPVHDMVVADMARSVTKHLCCCSDAWWTVDLTTAAQLSKPQQ